MCMGYRAVKADVRPCHLTSQILWITEQMFTVTPDRHGCHVHVERARRFITAPHVRALARGQLHASAQQDSDIRERQISPQEEEEE